MVDLLVVSLFFYLLSCKYTKTNSHRRTTQFLFQGMQFHDANDVILPYPSADVSMVALGITLFLDTQKIFVLG